MKRSKCPYCSGLILVNGKGRFRSHNTAGNRKCLGTGFLVAQAERVNAIVEQHAKPCTEPR